MRCVLCAVTLAACLTTRANGKPEVVRWEDRLRHVAGFEMNRPEETLEVVDLLRGERAGVSGCGQRAAYVYSQKVQGWTREPVEVVPVTPVVPVP